MAVETGGGDSIGWSTITLLSTLFRGALCLWLTWGNHLIRRAGLMANGKHPVSVCFLSPDLQIKIVQKSAKPPHIQHPTLPTFSDTTARRKGGGREKKKAKRKKGTATEASLPFAFSVWGLGSAARGAALAISSANVHVSRHVCQEHTCVSIIFICVYNQDREWGEFTGDILYTYCVHI